MPITGLNQGVSPIISFNFGAKKFDRIKAAEKLAIIAATAIVLTGWILTRLFPVQIVSLFNREPELIRFGSYALKTWFWCLPFIGFQILGANFFQAISRPGSAMVLTLTRQVLLLMPAVILFSRIWGLNGILYAHLLRRIANPGHRYLVFLRHPVAGSGAVPEPCPETGH
jgi:Na+-driven multidrug efflux pump